MCAGLGLDVTGIDLAATALRTAEDKAQRRGAAVRFLHHDARRLTDLGERFDTVLDSGLFHLLAPDDRPAFTGGLHETLRPGGRYFMLCFSDREPESGRRGPHRLSRDDITEAFEGALRIDSVEAGDDRDHPGRGGHPGLARGHDEDLSFYTDGEQASAVTTADARPADAPVLPPAAPACGRGTATHPQSTRRLRPSQVCAITTTARNAPLTTCW